MKAFVQAWANFVVDRRWLVILLSTVIILGSFVPMKGLYFDNSNEMWFVQGDPALKEYDQLVELFGDNEYVMIGLEARPQDPDIFTPDAFEIQYKLTEFLEAHESVTKVQSLSKYQIIKASDDEMVIEELVPEYWEDFDPSPAAMEKARQAMKLETLVHDQLITSDMKHVIISARAKYIKGTTDHHVKLMRDLMAFVDAQDWEEKGFQIRYTGTPAVNEVFFSSSMADQQFSLPLMFLFIFIVLIASFRTLSGIALPMLVIVGSVLISIGLIGAFGWALNMLNVTLPIILMAVAIGDSVHLLVEFYHLRNQGLDAKAAAKKSAEHLFVPCLNTSITTALGFGSIAVSKLQPLTQFGIVSALGVLAAFVLSLATLPAILSFFAGKPAKAKQIAEDGMVAHITNGITHHVRRHKMGIIGTCVILSLGSVYYASTLVVDSNFINFFKDGTKVKQDLDYFIKQYNGGMFLEYIVDTGRAGTEEMSGGALDPATLKRVKEFEEWLMKMPESGKTISLVDSLKKMNQSMHGDDPAWFQIPESRELVAQYLLLYSNSGPDEDLSDLKTLDDRYIRVSQRMTHMSSANMDIYIHKVKQGMATDFKDLNITITGMPVLYTNMDTYIHSGIIQSFTIALITIGLAFIVLLRSVKYGLLGMVPAVFPILVAAGIMGVMGLYVNFITMIIASVTFGIAVDNAIHILTRYLHHRDLGSNRPDAIDLAVAESGRALIFTTLILFFGFSILMSSTFIPNIHLGFFAGIILLMALIASLTLLPAIMFLQGEGKSHLPNPNQDNE